jgi:glutamate dehydrogenase (NADP+)
MSDSAGYIYDAEGIDAEKVSFVMELKNELRGRISEYVEKYPNAKYIAGNDHGSKCDIALPVHSKRIERRGS